MFPTTIYGIATGGVYIALLLYRITKFISYFVRRRTTFFLLKHVLYPGFIRRRRFINSMSRGFAVFTVIYWAGTAACNWIGVTSIPEAGLRAGTLSTLNFVPLLFVNRLSLGADLLGMSLRTYRLMHGSIGIMAFLQGLIHVLIILQQSPLRLQDTVQVFGFIGGVSIVVILFLSIFRSSYYEFVSKSHYALAILAAYVVWKHLDLKDAASRFYIALAALIFTLTTTAQFLRIGWRNIRKGRSCTVAKVRDIHGAIQIDILLPRPWKIHAGQYIYIWMPGTSFWSCLQSHPFMISWWDQEVGGKAEQISLLLAPQDGFTKDLVCHADARELRTWIDGPYGSRKNLGTFGKVILLATGIGIAALVPYIKELLREHKASRVNTRNILVIWQLQRERDENWVRAWMTELLEIDGKAKILHFKLYVAGGFEQTTTTYGTKEDYGTRIQLLYGHPDLPVLIPQEIDYSRKKTIFVVSADDEFRDSVRRLVQVNMTKNVEFMELDFQMRERRNLWNTGKPQVRFQGVV